MGESSDSPLNHSSCCEFQNKMPSAFLHYNGNIHFVSRLWISLGTAHFSSSESQVGLKNPAGDDFYYLNKKQLFSYTSNHKYFSKSM